jgi:two-component system response regulator HydG/two-component system response regulator AtoC
MAKILVVDDDSLSRQNISRFLSEDGHSVEQAADGSEALEQIRSGHFDLVLSDILMPKINGYAVIEFVHSTLPDTPVLLMTAYGGTSPAWSRAVEIVMKPINLDELSAAIRRLLAKKSIAPE